MRRTLSTVGAVVTVVVVTAASHPASGRLAPETSLQDPPGKALFEGKGNCFTCHRQDARGTPLAPDLTDSTWVNFEARPGQEEVERLIREGVADPREHPAPMPPMGGASLSDEEITQLAEYILTLAPE